MIGDAIRVHQGYDQVTKVLDFLTHNFGTIMVLQANAERLTQLWEACNEENEHFESQDPTQTVSKLEMKKILFDENRSGEAFALENVMGSAPGSPISVGGVTVDCKAGTCLLVSGCSD